MKTFDNLAYIVENHILIAAAMKELLTLKDNVHVLHNSSISTFNLPQSDENNVKIRLNDGSPIECGILVILQILCFSINFVEAQKIDCFLHF